MRKRLIYAGDLWHKTFVCEEPGDFRKAIENAPSVDAVEVVRCKDCKHWQESVDGITKWCPLLMDKETKADDFCSYGERKDND